MCRALGRRSAGQATEIMSQGGIGGIQKIPAPTSSTPKTPLGTQPPFANNSPFPNYMNKPKVGSSRIPFSLALALLANVPLGWIRQNYTEKFSLGWFASIHASIPLLMAWRNKFIPHPPQWLVPVNIACAVAGQWIGGRVRSEDLDQTLLIEGKDI